MPACLKQYGAVFMHTNTRNHVNQFLIERVMYWDQHISLESGCGITHDDFHMEINQSTRRGHALWPRPMASWKIQSIHEYPHL